MFSPVRHSVLVVRLAREARDAGRELAQRPSAFLSNIFQPDPVRGKSRYLGRLLTASVVLHCALIAYLAYLGLLAPFMGIRIVDEPYEQLDVAAILKLPYPAQKGRPAIDPRKVKTLDEIREEDRKRREKAERERLAREKAERERLEREERERKEREEREKAEAEKLAAEKAKEPPKPAQFGEINEKPIRDILSKVYAIHKAGGLGMDVLNFSMMATFKIEPDGSISNVKLIKSSGNRIIDENGILILGAIGASRALGPLAKLSSNSIRLDLDDKVARLTIYGFAPSPEEAKAIATQLNFLFAILRNARKGSDTAELMSMMKIRNDNRLVAADLTVSRARADEMMRASYGNDARTP